LKKVCQDRCFQWTTILKWVCTIGIFGYTIYAVDEARLIIAEQPKNFVVKIRTSDGEENFV